MQSLIFREFPSQWEGLQNRSLGTDADQHIAGNIMLKYLVAAAAFLAPLSANATAQGAWPNDFRGGTFAKPAWILVVPVQRQSNGSLAIFDRMNPWVREWIVPQATAQGIRTVTIVGDSEDKRLVSADDIDQMRGSALQKLARKYNAPAVAIAVSDADGTTAVAAWMPGRQATWDTPVEGEGKKALITALDAIFTGSERAVGTTSEQIAESRPAARIVAERLNKDQNKMEYRIEPLTREAEQLIGGSPSLRYLGQASGDGSVMEVRVMDGSTIETILAAVGVARQ
jgi:hypothetical protein